MQKPWIYLGSGRNRHTFQHGNYVVKVPKNAQGTYDNEYEARQWKRYGRKEHLARCRLLGNFPCLLLVMELVEPVREEFDKLPPWTGYIDCRQVGYTLKGELVAYDFGWY